MAAEVKGPIAVQPQPRWVGPYGKKYEGRYNYWAELGYMDPIAAKKKRRLLRPIIKENDPMWWDPPVPDGKSIVGGFGKDTKYSPHEGTKHQEPGSMEKFRKDLYDNSWQMKQIYANWDISPQHPGMKINPTIGGSQLPMESKWVGYQDIWIPTVFGTYTWRPRFFESPLHEDLLEKGAACAKLAAFAMIPVICWDAVMYTKEPYGTGSWWNVTFRAIRLLVHPMAAAAAWGSCTSLCCDLRGGTDDYINPLVGSAAAGSLLGSFAKYHRFKAGLQVSIILSIGSIGWQYGREQYNGMLGGFKMREHSPYPNMWRTTHAPFGSSYRWRRVWDEENPPK